MRNPINPADAPSTARPPVWENKQTKGQKRCQILSKWRKRPAGPLLLRKLGYETWFEAWFRIIGTSVLNPSKQAPSKIHYCRIPPSMVSLLRGFNILMKILSVFFTHTAQIWSEEVQVQCDLCTSTDILQHKRRYCPVSFSPPPSKPYTTNRQDCQEFFRGCHFASSSWYCSACRICVPVYISLFISASNIWQNMKPVYCNASDVWSKVLTMFHKALRYVKLWQQVLVSWNKSFVYAWNRCFLAGLSLLT
jgi:hypothetical protein